MAIETKVIGEFEVKVTRQKLRKRIALQARLIKLAGSAIADALGGIIGDYGGGDKEVELSEIDLQEVAVPFVKGIAETLEPEELLKVIDELLVGVFVNNADITQEVIFDKFFEEDEMFLFKVLAYSLEVNLSDFLGQKLISSGLQKLKKGVTE